MRRFRPAPLLLLGAGLLLAAACRRAEAPGMANPPPTPTPASLAGGPTRQNWRVRVRERVDPKDIAVSEKQKHTVVWEDPDDPAAKIHIVFEVPPGRWDPFPNRECPDAAHAANPCRSGRISPVSRGWKYTYRVFVTTAKGTKEIDPTILVDF